MAEIASIIVLVLKNTRPLILTKGAKAGEPSKAKAVTDPAAKEEAIARVHTLLDQFKLYPQLDVPFLQEYFPLDNQVC